MIKLRTVLIWSALLLTGVCHAFTCEWDEEILEMEVKTNPEWFDILVGQDDHHGEAYYLFQIKKLSVEGKLSVDERMELAIAYMEVGEYKRSKDILVDLISDDPEYVPAIFYRGVVAEWLGDYELAEVYLLRDLDINREGYLGIGNWYLELMRRRANPKTSHYGEIDFVEGWESHSSLTYEEYVERLFTLVRIDPTFAEGFYLIGIALDSEETCHLSQIAFARAERLSMRYLAPEGIWSTEKYRISRNEELEVEAPPEKLLLSYAEYWRKEYVQQEKIVANQGVVPTFKNMKSKTDIYEKKNQFSNNTVDGKWSIALFVFAVVLYSGYSYARSRNS